MGTVVVKYNAGNVRSVLFALERIGIQAVVSDDPAIISSADRVILPGVGEASSAMTWLREHHLDDVLRDLRQPVLGICLGMQLMCDYSEEGDTQCLGIIPQSVRRFPAASGLKIPQVGWNDICNLQSPLFENVSENSHVYFVHGFYVELGPATIATTCYSEPYSAALRHENFFATQFHPEKSGAVGHQILENFMLCR